MLRLSVDEPHPMRSRNIRVTNNGNLQNKSGFIKIMIRLRFHGSVNGVE